MKQIEENNMTFECIYHKLAFKGKLANNLNHKCFKCDGKGTKCLIGYNEYIQWLKEQQEGNEDNG